MSKTINRVIKTSGDLRGVLMASIEGVLEGKVSVQQANSVVGLSSEIHKSIRQDWDMRDYSNKNIGLYEGGIIKMVSSDEA